MNRSKWSRRLVMATVVLGVVFFATTALATSASVSHKTMPGYEYAHVGDTVWYRTQVGNPNSTPAMISVWITYPDGHVDTLDAQREWAAGEVQTYDSPYVVKGTEPLSDEPTPGEYEISSWGEFSAYLIVQPNDTFWGGEEAKVSILQPGVTASAAVDFDGDSSFSDTESNYAGNPATWQVVVENTGNCATTVTLSDSLGSDWGAPFVLAAGESRTVTATTSSIGATTPNTITATAVDRLGGEDGTVTSSETATAVVVAPSLSVETSVDFDGDGVFSDDSETGFIGDEATWRVVVTNNGTEPVTDIIVTDTNGHTFDTIPVLLPGASITFEYSSVVDETTTNEAAATGKDPLGGEVSGDDDATAVTGGRRYADISITKSANVATAVANDLVAYTLRIENVGNGTASGFTITDDFDERYVDVVDAAGGTVSGGKIVWAADADLAAGETRTITYTVRVKSEESLQTGTTLVDNTVVVELEEDPDEKNNTAKVTVTVDNPFLPFTPAKTTTASGDPYLPYTGANGLLLWVLAACAAGAGFGLRKLVLEREKA
ncbi:MAG: hypothetical protein JXA36_00805 [Coriobacteriia bacterium]|nr:hypothetical protein [Coriobacteriia bacterium]